MRVNPAVGCAESQRVMAIHQAPTPAPVPPGDVTDRIVLETVAAILEGQLDMDATLGAVARAAHRSLGERPRELLRARRRGHLDRLGPHDGRRPARARVPGGIGRPGRRAAADLPAADGAGGRSAGGGGRPAPRPHPAEARRAPGVRRDRGRAAGPPHRDPGRTSGPARHAVPELPRAAPDVRPGAVGGPDAGRPRRTRDRERPPARPGPQQPGQRGAARGARPADRPRQPPHLPRGPAPRGGGRNPGRPRPGPGADGHRPLQAGQRHVRAPGRRPGAGQRGGPPAGGGPRRGRRRAHRRRGVRLDPAGHRGGGRPGRCGARTGRRSPPRSTPSGC